MGYAMLRSFRTSFMKLSREACSALNAESPRPQTALLSSEALFF